MSASMYRSKKKQYKPRRFYKKKRGMGSSTYALAKRVRSLEATRERKHVDLDLFNSFIGVGINSQASSIKTIHAIAEGTRTNERIGRSITAKSLFIRGAPPDQGDNWCVRYYVVMDSQQQPGTVPVITDIFESIYPSCPLLNTNELGRFTLLWDSGLITRKLVENTSGAFKCYKKMDHTIKFDGIATSNVQKGGLYWVCLFFNNSTTTAISYSDEAVMSRLSYVDA